MKNTLLFLLLFSLHNGHLFAQKVTPESPIDETISPELMMNSSIDDEAEEVALLFENKKPFSESVVTESSEEEPPLSTTSSLLNPVMTTSTTSSSSQPPSAFSVMAMMNEEKEANVAKSKFAFILENSKRYGPSLAILGGTFVTAKLAGMPYYKAASLASAAALAYEVGRIGYQQYRLYQLRALSQVAREEIAVSSYQSEPASEQELPPQSANEPVIFIQKEVASTNPDETIQVIVAQQTATSSLIRIEKIVDNKTGDTMTTWQMHANHLLVKLEKIEEADKIFLQKLEKFKEITFSLELISEAKSLYQLSFKPTNNDQSEWVTLMPQLLKTIKAEKLAETSNPIYFFNLETKK